MLRYFAAELHSDVSPCAKDPAGPSEGPPACHASGLQELKCFGEGIGVRESVAD